MFPLIWGLTDLDNYSNYFLLAVIRLIQAMTITNTLVCPDEYWQAVEPAYKLVYGDVQDVELPWEFSD
jgi:hypothetical protein